LATAIPQVEPQAAEELDLAALDVDGGAEAARVGGELRLEDDGAHRRLARARLAHEEDLQAG